jgi:predicted extracellular nuclease
MTKSLYKLFSAISILALVLMAMPMHSAEAATPTELFFSEYVEGSSFNKAIEVYNGTGGAVNLSTYSIELYSNGAAAPSQTVALSGTLADGDVFVIAHGSADAAILAVADATSSSVINFNGDDALVLRNNGAVVDSFGQVGVDPGTEWTGGGVDDTLRRAESVCAGDTDPTNAFDASSEWVTFAANTFDGLGSHTTACGGDTTDADLFLSEYIEGSSFNKAIEIYNGTGSTVDLAAGLYTLELYSNGSVTASQTVALTGSLASGDVLVLAHGSADAAILAQADIISSSVINFNGDDAVVLRKNGVVIDVFGQIGFDPGSEWAGGGVDDTLRRAETVCAGDTNPDDAFNAAAEWVAFATNTFDGLGSHTANCGDTLSTVINEALVSHTGTDNTEFLELYGEPGASLDGLSLIVIESDSGASLGAIDRRIDFGPSDALGTNGFYLIGNPTGLGLSYGVIPNLNVATDFFENSSLTLALVETSSITGTSITGSEIAIDTVGITDGGAGDTFFLDAPVIGPDGTFLPAGVRRVTDGVDTNTAADWVISDFNLGPANTPTAGTGADVAPTVSSTNPADGATNVPVGSDISMTFSESVDVAAGAISVQCPAGTEVASNAAASDVTEVTIDPASDLPGTTSCSIVIDANGVTDNDGTPNALTGTTSFSFTTGTASGITPIHTIQGSGDTSAAGTFTVEAIVVGDYQTQGSGQLRGFFIQEEDADADADLATSEGIFVFCTTCPVPVNVGDKVRVTGSSSEFFGMSQLTASTAGSVIVLSSGNSLPTPASIELPVPGLPSGDLAAATAAINAYMEPREGMLVTFPDTLSVSEYFELARYGQVILTEGGRPHTFTAVNTPSAAGFIDNEIALASRTVILDDTDNRQNRPVDTPNTPYYHPVPGLSATNFFRGGDTITNLTGVLHWSFAGQNGTDAWRIRPVTEAFSYAFTPANPRPGMPDVGGHVKVASFNVLNYFLTIDTTSSNDVGTCGPTGTMDCRGADSAEELVLQREKMLAALEAIDADVFGFMEMENTPGVEPLADIVAGLPGYAYIDTGVTGTDAIRVGIIYKTSTVTPVGDVAVLDTQAFVNPRNADVDRNRPAVAQTFEDLTKGGRFTVVVNHLKSKGSGCGANDDDTTTGQGNCTLTRTLAAQELAAWLATDPTGSGDADVLIIGDLNSYAKEDPIVALQNAGYTDLVAQFGGPSAYGYVFDGQLGYLDHALANDDLLSEVTGVAEWHINADEIPLLDYNDDVRTTGEAAFEEESDVLPLYAPNEFRTSDHDPVIVGLNVCDEIAPTFDELSVSPDMLWSPNHKYVDVTATVTVSDNFDTNPTITLVSVTSNEPDNAPGKDDGNTIDDIVIVDDFNFKLRAERSDTGTGRVYTITYMVTDACGNSTTQSVTVTVPLQLGD